jgi:hypothetical protein
MSNTTPPPAPPAPPSLKSLPIVAAPPKSVVASTSTSTALPPPAAATPQAAPGVRPADAAAPSASTSHRLAPSASSLPVASAVPTAPKSVVFKPNILIVGDAMSGKTSALRNLDWSKVRLVDTERKGFPFDGVPANIDSPTTSVQVEKAMFSSTEPIVVLDSFTKYIELLDKEMNEQFSGHTIWSEYNNRLRDFLNRCKSTTRIFILTAIPEILSLMSADGISAENVRRVRTRGKMWEGQIEKEFSIVLYTLYRTDMKAQPGPITKYYFQTGCAGINRARTPINCFPDMYVENDIAAVLATLEKFYSRPAATAKLGAVSGL